MKKSSLSPLGLDPRGVGPFLIISALPFVIAGVVLSYWQPQLAIIPISFSIFIRLVGLTFLIAGSVIWIAAIAQFAIGFKKGLLITNGIFALSRNPIYASWFVLILPGLFLFYSNFWFLLAAIAMFVAFKMKIKKEEECLKNVFGSIFIEYCEKVGRVCSFPKK
ncbi:MAG: methyltransferase [Bacteroidales bacterium]|nr:methyltransferase [Bacteroidales bacterium]